MLPGGRFRQIQIALGQALLVCCLGVLAAILVLAVQGYTKKGETVALKLKPEQTAFVRPPMDTGGLLNLNTATLEELMALPGVGEHLAAQVIRQRAIHPFYFVEDLRVVSGFGDKRIEALRGLVYAGWPEGSATEAPVDEQAN